jgi:murein DD-endopeptidase MepM/ murein hydrolase activator NlpD
MPQFPFTVWTKALDVSRADNISGPPLSGPVTAPFRSIDPAHPTWHSGVDIAANFGTPVVAAGAGVVDQVGVNGVAPLGVVFGHCITIRHTDGTYALYAHLEHPPIPPVGAQVQVGDQLGSVGMTGQTTGPHLHWGLAVAGNRYFAKEANGGLLDPLQFAGLGVAPPSDARTSAAFELRKFAESALKFADLIEQNVPKVVAQQNMTWLQGKLPAIMTQVDSM